MSLLSSLFGRYDKGATFLTGREINRILHSSINYYRRKLPRNDGGYLCLTIENYKRLVEDAVTVRSRKYDPSGRGFPDCDDFGFIARAQVLDEALNRDFDYTPAFFTIEYDTIEGGAHFQNLAIAADGIPWLYEPQTGKWTSDISAVRFTRHIGG